MEQFLKILLGEMELPIFLGYYAVAFLSAILMLAIRANNKRKVNGNDTPYHFSLSFFIQDNILKFIINLLTIGFAIRFCNEIMGSEITGWISFLIGIGLNEISVRLQSLQSKARE